MDYKKRNEEILEKLRTLRDSWASTNNRAAKEIEESIPELIESEDERIRKEIIDFATKANNGVTSILANNYNFNKWIALLEKKAEQKSADNVEPKFKVGDWIIDVQGVSANQIIGYEDDSYHIKTSCSVFYLPMKLAEKNYRLWTIQDAKAGDVLACESGWTCIFKTLVNDKTFSSYCFMDNSKWFCETGSESHTLEKAFVKAYNGNIYPATKEQRDNLEKAMADAGYAFDFEKKELKKIEQKPAEWSEEDEDAIAQAIIALEDMYDEDDPHRCYSGYNLSFKESAERLKSLRPQNRWKPDSSMLICLEYAIKHLNKDGDKRILSKLLEQLKKLREE